MSHLEYALALAAEGFWIFPCQPPPGKKPAIKGWQMAATRDRETITAWWKRHPDRRIGIYTSKFADGRALVVVDVDVKPERNGEDTIFRLDMEGFELPETRTHTTPRGGRHLIYRHREAVKQGANVLGPAVDIRSKGGYIVAYEGAGTVVQAPQWLIERCGRAIHRDAPAGVLGTVSDGRSQVDRERAERRGADYLLEEAPLAVEGDTGDDTTYRVACRLKDMGLVEPDCLALLAEHWNPRCSPPWNDDELAIKVANAYRYGQEPIGAAAPETQFAPVPPPAEAPLEGEVLHPFEKLNRNYGFVLAGGGHHILWETMDVNGVFRLEHLAEASFHKKFAALTMTYGEKTVRVTKLWMSDPSRRSYDGICFRPGLEVPPGWYNLWRGFAYEPLAKGETPSREAQGSLDAFLEHARGNVCRGNETEFRWLMGWFAQLVQRPWEKPLVGLVFKGEKGVGKNAIVERVGALLGGSFLLTSKRRYLVGNFNGHLENLLLFALDEAFWSGDKEAEGVVKDIVTGATHIIEHKNEKPYTVENRTRIVVIGNEEWLVPASYDERRWAVFLVGEGRKQDKPFFVAMREGMERGGYRLLLRYLLDYDLTGIDVNEAPKSDALLDQKINSLEPLHQWWLSCLTEGTLANGDFEGWPTTVEKSRFRQAFERHFRAHNIRSRVPQDHVVGRQLKACLPSIDGRQKQSNGQSRVNVYRIPALEQARAEWEKFIGHAVAW